MKWVHLIALLLLIVPCGASSVNVTVNTSVMDSNYLDVGIWIVILLLGIFFFVLSNLTTKDTGAPLWALIAPFFTFAAMYFSTMLQYVQVTTYYDSGIDTYRSVTEHFIYHLDWIGVGLLGVLFIFSFINTWYILSKSPVEKPQRDEVFSK